MHKLMILERFKVGMGIIIQLELLIIYIILIYGKLRLNHII